MRFGTGCASLALVLLASAALAASQRAPISAHEQMDVFIVGDSTAAFNPPERYPQLGWGMVLQCAFDDGIVVRNYAKSGRSTKSFIDEGFFDEVAQQIGPGDTLLIQFGHNDEKSEDPTRYTDPGGTFRINLLRYVSMARNKGAQPVLITPVARRRFQNGELVDTHGAYAQAVRDLARQSHTPLIDLAADSMEWLRRAGEHLSKGYFLHYTADDKIAAYPNGVEDNTHFSELGARAVAELVGARLAGLDIPVAARVKRIRPALTRATPLGGPQCE